MIRPGITETDIRIFRNQSIYARAIFVHYRHLFESGADNAALLTTIAPVFFGDLCRALRAQIILEVCKLTDPTGTRRQNENLTIELFVRKLDGKDHGVANQLKELSDHLHGFRKKVKPARDKIISHSDRATILSGKSLGGVDIDAWDQFWLDLDRFVNVLSSQYLGEPSFHLNAVSNQTDVPRLLAALQSPGSISLPVRIPQ
jgi:hypothetical protein